MDLKSRLLKHIDIIGGHWLWNGCTFEDGYPRMWKDLRAHRISYEVFVGEIVNGNKILHRCDIPLCINPDHLFQGSTLDNARDMVAKGRSAKGSRSGARKHPEMLVRGEEHPWSRLTWEIVDSIRDEYGEGNTSYTQLAKKHKVSKSGIRNIVTFNCWKEMI